MKLSEAKKKKYTEIINQELDRVEDIWEKNHEKLVKHENSLRKLSEAKAIVTTIPGHKIVKEGEGKVDEFSCLILDIRDSTKHMIEACKSFDYPYQRAFYETSALLKICGYIVEEYSGSVTEYLGDGFLALFNKDELSEDNLIYNPFNASKMIILMLEEVLNPILKERYSLEPLYVGIGLARSKAIVCSYGFGDSAQGKVFGRCVYDASKLANDKLNMNKIIIHELFRKSWPKTSDGKLKFTTFNGKNKNLDGFEPMWRE